MPVIPMVRQKDWDGARIPTVMSADAAPLARGGRALARGISDLGQAAAGVAERVKERKTREEVDSMLADYDERETYAWNGRPGEAGAEPVRGVKDWGEGDGSAAEAMQAVLKEWHENPEGLYKKASPEAQRRVDRALRARTARMFSLAAQKDTHTAEVRRQNAAAAALATSERSAMMYAYDDGLFTAAAIDATDAAARLKLDRLIVNHGEPDPEKLRFKSEDGKALYDAARAEHFDKLRFSRARTLAEGAGIAESESVAAARMAMAAAVAETLPPALKPAALNLIETVRARRLDGMLGLARAEPDLDKRERLLQIAERSAKDYGAGGKLLGAVAEEARRARDEAQREENRLAMAALAEGKEYDPGENPRRKAALAWAAPKIEKARQAERAAASAARHEEFKAAEAWHSTLLRMGIRIDPETGEAVPMDEAGQLDHNLDLLEGGQIGPHAFRQNNEAIRRKADKASQERSARLAADICAAVGTDIALLSKKDADPAQEHGKVTVTETERRMVPVMETVTGYRQGFISGGRPTMERYTVERDTGRREERATVIRRKRELLTADIRKLIRVAEMARDARGLKVDLDGLPATPPEQVDPDLFTRRLIGDLKRRQLSVDIDAALDGLADAIVERGAARAARAGRAVANSPAWSFGPADADAADEEDAADEKDESREEED